MAEYIERETALNTVAKIMSDYNICHKNRALKKRIKSLPAANVEPVRHGRWKYYKNNGIINIYKCDNCNAKVETTSDELRYNYCPNCGARMGGEENA